jgi:hypothetical protein
MKDWRGVGASTNSSLTEQIDKRLVGDEVAWHL